MGYAARAGAVLLSLLWGACRFSSAYRVETLTLERIGWDTLIVEARFTVSAWWGSRSSVSPDSVQFLLLNARYDTLFWGTSARMPVPDVLLGDRERLLLEVCGWFQGRSVCDQVGFTASPKRLQVRPEIQYPYQGKIARLYYRLHPHLERQRYATATWESIPVAGAPQGYLQLQMAEDPQSTVQWPLKAWEGVVELAQLPTFLDFRYALSQKLRAGEVVTVTIAIYAGLPQPVQVASFERRLRAKTEAERKAEVARLAEAALEQLVHQLSGHAYTVWIGVESWSFNPLALQYVVEIVARWREKGWLRPTCTLRGILTVAEDSTQATFRWVEGNRIARQHWEARVAGEVLRLDPLTIMPDGVQGVQEEAVVSGW